MSDRLSGSAQPANAVRLSILLVNYNGMQHLGSCLESIQRFAGVGTQTILEDNASTDGSVEAAEASYPWVEVVRSDRNLGFSKGNNLAGKSARGKFVLLLNTDAQLLEPLEPILDWLENHGEIGALTINMLDGNNVPRACTGRFPSPLRLAFLRTMLLSPATFGAQEKYVVDWVQGSFLLMRADLWRTLNGLDESYFMYAEDVDLCKRIHDSGFGCAFLPKYSYLHWGGFSTDRFPDQVRSLANYVDLHMKGLRRLLSHAILLAGCLLRAALFRLMAVLQNREIYRPKAAASWRGFVALIKRDA
jgi:GT2 family glycosyltransferase